jgi:hypothetical protein
VTSSCSAVAAASTSAGRRTRSSGG